MKKLNKKFHPAIIEKSYERDEEGRIIVNMNVKDDSDFLSVFSSTSTPVISGDVAEFLENSTRFTPANEELSLHIKSDCVDDDEKKLYRAAIKEYYTEKYHANEKELRFYNTLALFLAIFGVIVLALAIYLGYVVDTALWSEVIDVVAWVLLWEAVDIKFFKSRELLVTRRKYRALSMMKIAYFPLDSEK